MLEEEIVIGPPPKTKQQIEEEVKKTLSRESFGTIYLSNAANTNYPKRERNLFEDKQLLAQFEEKKYFLERMCEQHLISNDEYDAEVEKARTHFRVALGFE